MPLRTHTPWLAQGDVFELLPQIGSELDLAGEVVATVDVGASLLITHDCDLDKPSGKDGPPRIDQLQFLPLRDLGQQDPQRQTLARRNAVQPPEPIYVGQVAGIGEAFGLLSQAYYLPSGFFAPDLQAFPEHPEAEPGQRHLVAGRHSNRIGRLDDAGVHLMQRKISAYYTRRDPGPIAT